MNTWADTYLYFAVEFVLSSSSWHFHTVGVYSLARVCRFFLAQHVFNSTRTLLGGIFFTFILVISFFFFTDGFNWGNWPPCILFCPICWTFCCNFKIICLSELECQHSKLSPCVSLRTAVSQNKVLCACLKYLGGKGPRVRIPFREV